MVAIGCASCGASLEITPDLDVFACGYCGSQQRVERKGGTVALRKVESAIKAVQRGTDKTAAELAIPRLERELVELEAIRQNRLRAAAEGRASQERGRLILSLVVFGVALFVWSAISEHTPNFPGKPFVAALLVFGVPIFVYLKVKMSGDQIEQINREFEERAAPIRQRIRLNRSVADA